MRDAGLITSTALLAWNSSTYLGWLELPQRVADRAFSQGSYSKGSRGTSGNILLNTSPLILSGSSLCETLGWLASLSAQGPGSGGCTSLEIIAKTSIVIVARRSCQSNTLRRLVPFRTVAAIQAVPVSVTRSGRSRLCSLDNTTHCVLHGEMSYYYTVVHLDCHAGLVNIPLKSVI